MTTVQGFGALGRMLDSEFNDLANAGKKIKNGSDRDVALVITAAVARQLGGQKIILRGVGKKGGAVGVVTRKTTEGQEVKMTGKAAPLIERDTKAHTIIGKKVGRLGKGKGSRSAAAKHAAKQDLYNALFGGTGGGLHLGGGHIPYTDTGFTSKPIKHPGTKGKHPFEKGVDVGRLTAERLVEAEYLRQARKFFS